jgi:hypothetical protein
MSFEQTYGLIYLRKQLHQGEHQMSRHSIPKNSAIYHYFRKIGLVMYFRFSIILHMISFVEASTQKGFRGKITEISDFHNNRFHRTTFGKMLDIT